MTKVDTGVFIQDIKNAGAKTTAAAALDGTNAALVATVGDDGGLLVGASVIPKATDAAGAGYLFVSYDSGVTLVLLEAVALPGGTYTAAAPPARTHYSFSLEAPFHLPAAARVYMGTSQALAGGYDNNIELLEYKPA